MSRHETDCACGIGAVSTRIPFESVCNWKTAIGAHGIEAVVPGGLTAKAIAAQPAWLAALRVEGPLPEGARVIFTGCGTSYHAALAAGHAAHALDVVLGDAPDADVLVAVSHEGETTLTLEAVQGFAGETWAITGKGDSPIPA